MKKLCLFLAMLLFVSGYASIDSQQATEERCMEIAEYVDEYLEPLEYFPIGYSVEWIGYYKYSEQMSREEYEEMQIGGYYSYTGNLSTGELATARISMYWDEGEEPEIINLNIESGTTENPIIPYDEAKIKECWETYKEKSGE